MYSNQDHQRRQAIKKMGIIVVMILLAVSYMFLYKHIL